MSWSIGEDDLTLYSIPVIALLILLEVIVSVVGKRRLYDARETLTTFYLMALAVGVNVMMRGFYLWIFGVFHAVRIMEITDPVIYWIALLVAQDFLFYVLHVVDHYCRLFWAVHVTHHNSTDYNLCVGFRSSVFQPLYRFAYYIPLAWLGFRPLDILFMYSLTQIWGVFVHTKLIARLPGWIEYVFVTPSHHRVHHGSNPLYIDKNMGMFLIVWDRMFGTFQEELASEPVRYGLAKNPVSRGPLNIVFHEFKAILADVAGPADWRTKLKHVFFAPGWRRHSALEAEAGARPAAINTPVRAAGSAE